MEKIYKTSELVAMVKSTIKPLLATYRIMTFQGPLGVGKTTLIKALLKECGVTETVTSPSFGYVNTYKGSQGLIFHHFDLYRIDSIDSFVSGGFDELLYQENAICLIEWPEIIQSLLADKALQQKVCGITLSYVMDNDQVRCLRLENHRKSE